MKNHKEPYGAIRNQKESYGPLIWVNRTNRQTNKRTDSLLELAGFYPPAKNKRNKNWPKNCVLVKPSGRSLKIRLLFQMRILSRVVGRRCCSQSSYRFQAFGWFIQVSLRILWIYRSVFKTTSIVSSLSGFSRPKKTYCQNWLNQDVKLFPSKKGFIYWTTGILQKIKNCHF